MTYQRVPLWLQNPEFAKSMFASMKGATDFQVTDKVESHPLMDAQYRTPPDRQSGNVLFRRYPDGTLDFEYCKHEILDALNLVRAAGPATLNTAQQAALCCVFPDMFDFIDSTMIDAVRKVQCKVSKDECNTLKALVAMHIAKEQNWNGGFGSGTVGFPTAKE